MPAVGPLVVLESGQSLKVDVPSSGVTEVSVCVAFQRVEMPHKA